MADPLANDSGDEDEDLEEDVDYDSPEFEDEENEDDEDAEQEWLVDDVMEEGLQAIENGFLRGDEAEAVPQNQPPVGRIDLAFAALRRLRWRHRFRAMRDRPSTSSSSTDDEAQAPEDEEPQPLNVQDAANHGYLFTERTRRREGQIGEILEVAAPADVIIPGKMFELPLVRISEDAFPMPNQRIPLLLFHPIEIAAVNFAVAHHCFLAAVPTYSAGVRPAEDQPSDIGLLLQIDRSCDGGDRGLRVHAIGRQRFKGLEEIRNFDGTITVRVEILPELLLPPLSSNLIPLFAKTQPVTIQRKLLEKVSNIPRWVANSCSTEARAHALVDFICGWSTSDEMKTTLEAQLRMGLTEFSFFVAATLPIDMHMKLALLRENSVDCRIVMLSNKLFKNMDLSCIHCKAAIAPAEEIFSLTTDASNKHFVNNHGFIHEIITSRQANNIEFRGEPESSFSWFEGYKWQIIECSMCLEHLGWKYTSKKYEPKTFFGLTRRAVALCERKENQQNS